MYASLYWSTTYVPSLTPPAPPATRLNYYVNDGLYGSFNCNVYDHANPQPTLALQLSAGGEAVDRAILLTPQALAERTRVETAKWAKAIREAKIEAE